MIARRSRSHKSGYRFQIGAPTMRAPECPNIDGIAPARDRRAPHRRLACELDLRAQS
jgi:hypothetical protein